MVTPFDTEYSICVQINCVSCTNFSPSAPRSMRRSRTQTTFMLFCCRAADILFQCIGGESRTLPHKSVFPKLTCPKECCSQTSCRRHLDGKVSITLITLVLTERSPHYSCLSISRRILSFEVSVQSARQPHAEPPCTELARGDHTARASTRLNGVVKWVELPTFRYAHPSNKSAA